MKSCLHKKRATKPNHIIQKKRAITKTSGEKNREQSNRITSPSSNTMISTKTSEKKQRAIKQIHIIIIKQNHSSNRIFSTKTISIKTREKMVQCLSPKESSALFSRKDGAVLCLQKINQRESSSLKQFNTIIMKNKKHHPHVCLKDHVAKPSFFSRVSWEKHIALKSAGCIQHTLCWMHTLEHTWSTLCAG